MAILIHLKSTVLYSKGHFARKCLIMYSLSCDQYWGVLMDKYAYQWCEVNTNGPWVIPTWFLVCEKIQIQNEVNKFMKGVRGTVLNFNHEMYPKPIPERKWGTDLTKHCLIKVMLHESEVPVRTIEILASYYKSNRYTFKAIVCTKVKGVFD